MAEVSENPGMLEGSTLGALVELMVEAEILAGSEGRLIPSRVEPDVDHRDIVVAEVGGFGALWLQVKGTTHPDREGRIVAFANYPVDAIPESARLLYLVCLLDVARHLLARTWLVPSGDFNQLAYREHSAREGRVTLFFFNDAATAELYAAAGFNSVNPRSSSTPGSITPCAFPYIASVPALALRFSFSSSASFC